MQGIETPEQWVRTLNIAFELLQNIEIKGKQTLEFHNAKEYVAAVGRAISEDQDKKKEARVNAAKVQAEANALKDKEEAAVKESKRVQDFEAQIEIRVADRLAELVKAAESALSQQSVITYTNGLAKEGI